MKSLLQTTFLAAWVFQRAGLVLKKVLGKREKVIEREQEWEGCLWFLSRARSTAASTVEPIWVSPKTSFPSLLPAGMGRLICSRRSNVTVGETEERMMLTGLHAVADIFCVGCGSIVGWKYEIAHEKGQKYKEGKSVLERFKISGPDGSNYWFSHEAHGGSDADDV